MNLEASIAATTLLHFAIGIQLSQMPFMVLLARRLGVREALKSLPPLGLAFFKLFAAGIVLCVSGLALLLLLHTEDAVGTPLGRHLVAFLAGFSLYRLERQVALGRVWPSDTTKVAHWLLLVVHGTTTVMYTAAWQLAG